MIPNSSTSPARDNIGLSPKATYGVTPDRGCTLPVTTAIPSGLAHLLVPCFAGSGPYSRYQAILDAAKKGGSKFLYEAWPCSLVMLCMGCGARILLRILCDSSVVFFAVLFHLLVASLCTAVDMSSSVGP